MPATTRAKTPQPLTFIDTETTGLDPDHHDAWEIAVIHRRPGHPDAEYLWQIRVSLAEADPEALDINHYHQRFAVPTGELAVRMATGEMPENRAVTGRDLMLDLMAILDNSVLVGSNPAFDERFLTKLFNSAGATPAWHYRTIDIATLAAGFMWAQEPELMAKDTKPISSRWLSRQVGVEPPGDDVAHTALGDARWARDVYDAITRGGQR
ncbi:hypothetical protein ACIFUY_06775 [Streptomyces sp. CACIS-1.16CA]|uniref:hypothetical protein n=1 Tax=Streptomyces sp. CACIS-1.16CA TaxID=1175510 RepID=UPI0037D29498